MCRLTRDCHCGPDRTRFLSWLRKVSAGERFHSLSLSLSVELRKKKPPLCIALCMAHRATASRSPAYISSGGEQKKPKSGKCGKPFCRMPLQTHIHMPIALKVNELCSGNSNSRSRSSVAKQRSNKQSQQTLARQDTQKRQTLRAHSITSQLQVGF